MLVKQQPAARCPARNLSSDPPGTLRSLAIEVNTSGDAHGLARSHGRDGILDQINQLPPLSQRSSYKGPPQECLATSPTLQQLASPRASFHRILAPKLI